MKQFLIISLLTVLTSNAFAYKCQDKAVEFFKAINEFNNEQAGRETSNEYIIVATLTGRDDMYDEEEYYDIKLVNKETRRPTGLSRKITMKVQGKADGSAYCFGHMYNGPEA